MPRDPETIARQLIEEGFNQGNLDVCDELAADNLVEHQDFGPGHALGPEVSRPVEKWTADAG